MNEKKTNGTPALVRICLGITLVCVLLLVLLSFRSRGIFSPRTEEPVSGELRTDMVPDEVSDYLFCNEYTAAGEWEAYQRSYDPDGSKLSESLGSEEIGQGYTLYRVYTSEMAMKLDELTAGRGLRLNKTMHFCYSAEELYAALGCGAFLPEGSECVGYLFDTGSFHFDGSFRGVDYRFDLQKKGSFSEALLSTPTHEDEQWVYVSRGQPLLLSLGSEQCLIHTALEQAYLTVTLPYPAADAEGSGISGVLLESLADSIHWDRIEG